MFASPVVAGTLRAALLRKDHKRAGKAAKNTAYSNYTILEFELIAMPVWYNRTNIAMKGNKRVSTECIRVAR